MLVNLHAFMLYVVLIMLNEGCPKSNQQRENTILKYERTPRIWISFYNYFAVCNNKVFTNFIRTTKFVRSNLVYLIIKSIKHVFILLSVAVHLTPDVTTTFEKDVLHW